MLEFHPNVKRLMEILEIDLNNLYIIKSPMKFENIILPDESFFGKSERFFTKEYREMIDRIKHFALENQSPIPNKKIYFFYGSYQVGEELLAKYFYSKGYEIISPQRLFFDQQLNILINAESFASTIGSCSHNSVFLREGTETILIPRTAKGMNAYQTTLEQIYPHNTNYIDSTLSIFSDIGKGANCFIISEQLKKFFGDEFEDYSEEDFKVFLSYIRNCMSQGMEINKETLQYYAPIYQKFFEQLSRREDLLNAYRIKLSLGENFL